MPSSASFGALERKIMAFLWKHQSATVAEIHTALRPSHPTAYTTVMTVMNRLVDKGILVRRADGRAFRYATKEPKETLARRATRTAVRSLIRDFGQAAVAHFVEALDDVDERLVRELRRSLNDHAG